jgi:DNA-binding MarR family transcriptional regulator
VLIKNTLFQSDIAVTHILICLHIHVKDVSMSVRKPLGQHLSLQKRAANILQSEDFLTHDELHAELDIDSQQMQAVIRGLSDNGLLKQETDDTGRRRYSVPADADIELFFDAV